MRLDLDGRYNEQDAREKLRQTLTQLGVDVTFVDPEVMASCVDDMRNIPCDLNQPLPIMQALFEQMAAREARMMPEPWEQRGRTYRKMYR